MHIIDVRTKEEFDQGHIEGAILFDIMDMMSGHYPNVRKDQTIVLYCESGNRAMMAESMLVSQGFSCVQNGGAISDMIKKGHKATI